MGLNYGHVSSPFAAAYTNLARLYDVKRVFRIWDMVKVFINIIGIWRVQADSGGYRRTVAGTGRINNKLDDFGPCHVTY